MRERIDEALPPRRRTRRRRRRRLKFGPAVLVWQRRPAVSASRRARNWAAEAKDIEDVVSSAHAALLLQGLSFLKSHC